MKSIFGGSLEFDSQEKLLEFGQVIERPTAFKILENAIEYGMKNGLYSLEEAYCLYVSLNKVRKERECHGFREPSQFPEIEIDKDGKS